MKLFVGLGNPGSKYAGNRHNIGFMAMDRIADAHGFAPWRSKFQGDITEGRIGQEKLVLLKPATFMNLSGQSVGEAMRFYKMALGDLVVFHDELDLAPGKLRLKQGGGHAGHNGLRSIHAHAGPDYARVRLGIGHPGHKDRVSAYVLSDFAKSDHDWLEALLQGIADGAGALAKGDGAGFSNKVAQHTTPQRTTPQRKGPPQTSPADAARKPQPAKHAPLPQDQPQDPPAADTRSPLQRLMDRFK